MTTAVATVPIIATAKTTPSKTQTERSAEEPARSSVSSILSTKTLHSPSVHKPFRRDHRDYRDAHLPRRLPSLLARISSAAAGGAVIAVNPSRSFRQLNGGEPPALRTATPNRSPGTGGSLQSQRDGLGIPDTHSVKVSSQTLHKTHIIPLSHSHDPSRPQDSTASALSRTSSSAHISTVEAADDKSQELDRRTSTSTSSTAQPDSVKSNTRGRERKMHQTSSRLLRMTDDDRPFTRDFKDLFSTLMVSLPLTSHRVRFQKIEHTFTSDEAVTNLGSLKFSQSNRMPDPKDPSRIVTTTTTTTFSMAKEMARSVCAKFLEARFVESADGKNDFTSKSAVWQLTPKGMHILQRFCQRNGINQRHVFELLASPRNTMNLVLLERQHDTDKLHRDVATIEVVFRRFVGPEPNIKYSISNSDSDSLSEYQTGLVGVKLAKERKVGDKTFHNTFTGKAVSDWLMDCCTMVDRREVHELAQWFCDFQLMQPLDPHPQHRFSSSKSVIYTVTEKGQRIAGWIASPKPVANGDLFTSGRPREGGTRDSNTNRMIVIIGDAALRLLFREFLRDTHCEENLAFYLDVRDFLANYALAKKSSATPKLEIIRETLAAAYSLYNAFLAPGSPCELNIDHSLRTSLAARMTRAVGDDEAMIKSLDEVATLFDQAQNSVFKLMASDSVPKFMREPKYATIIRERNLDHQLGSFISPVRISPSRSFSG